MRKNFLRGIYLSAVAASTLALGSDHLVVPKIAPEIGVRKAKKPVHSGVIAIDYHTSVQFEISGDLETFVVPWPLADPAARTSAGIAV